MIHRLLAPLPLLALCSAFPAAAEWQFNLPETSILPSAFSVEGTNNMGERHGGSTLRWTGVNLTVPLADPRRSGVDDWYVNAALDMTYTQISTNGALQLDSENFYNFTLPLSVIHPMERGRRLIFNVSPRAATDCGGFKRSLTVNGFVDYRFYSKKVADRDVFNCSVGLACVPNESTWPIIPIFSFDWNTEHNWTVRMQAARAEAMWTPEGKHLPSVGFFVKAIGNSWATHGEEGTRLFRVRGLALGPRMEYNFAKGNQTKRIWFAELGLTCFTNAEIYRYSDRHNADEMRHYHPGLYYTAGVDFRF